MKCVPFLSLPLLAACGVDIEREPPLDVSASIAGTSFVDTTTTAPHRRRSSPDRDTFPVATVTRPLDLLSDANETEIRFAMAGESGLLDQLDFDPEAEYSAKSCDPPPAP